MALRRSRRLQKLQPEETNLGLCLICQGDFEVAVLHRLYKTDCCQTLFHTRVAAPRVATNTSRKTLALCSYPKSLIWKLTWRKRGYSCWCSAIRKVLLRPCVSRGNFRKKLQITDFVGYPYLTDQARCFGTFCLILSPNIFFYLFVCH